MQTFLYWTALLSALLNAARLCGLCCKEDLSIHTFIYHKYLKGCIEQTLIVLLGIVQIYGIIQVFGTNSSRCDGAMWTGAYNYVMYTFCAWPLVGIIAVCMRVCFAALMGAIGESAAGRSFLISRSLAEPLLP